MNPLITELKSKLGNELAKIAEVSTAAQKRAESVYLQGLRTYLSAARIHANNYGRPNPYGDPAELQAAIDECEGGAA